MTAAYVIWFMLGLAVGFAICMAAGGDSEP